MTLSAELVSGHDTGMEKAQGKQHRPDVEGSRAFVQRMLGKLGKCAAHIGLNERGLGWVYISVRVGVLICIGF